MLWLGMCVCMCKPTWCLHRSCYKDCNTLHLPMERFSPVRRFSDGAATIQAFKAHLENSSLIKQLKQVGCSLALALVVALLHWLTWKWVPASEVCNHPLSHCNQLTGVSSSRFLLLVSVWRPTSLHVEWQSENFLFLIPQGTRFLRDACIRDHWIFYVIMSVGFSDQCVCVFIDSILRRCALLGVRAAAENVCSSAGWALVGAHAAATCTVPARAADPPPADPGSLTQVPLFPQHQAP